MTAHIGGGSAAAEASALITPGLSGPVNPPRLAARTRRGTMASEIFCSSTYGIGRGWTAPGGPSRRSSSRADLAWPAGPNQAAASSTAGRPRSDPGTNGAGGAVSSMARTNSSSPPVSVRCW